jgi:hypothetical protein
MALRVADAVAVLDELGIERAGRSTWRSALAAWHSRKATVDVFARPTAKRGSERGDKAPQ